MKRLELDGRIALVTGAARGIGRATALELARGGAVLALAGRSEASLGDTAAAVRALGGTVGSLHEADLASAKAATGLAGTVLARHGRLDILVNNAGALTLGRPEELAPGELARMLAVNVVAPYALMRAILPAMKARSAGVIVNISSIRAHLPDKGFGAYCATKAGLLAITQCLHRELAGTGVRVLALSPGLTATGMADAVHAYSGPQAGTVPEDVPPPERSARVIAWLASDEAADLAGADVILQFNAVTLRAGLETGLAERAA
ncbi:MAG: SDR family oxidoreductase [Alphaproteobacteria bacterium]|nr:SDR family oxidoreductase [Alphaproteobacteria bacterium]